MRETRDEGATMEFDLNEEHQLIRQTARRIAQDVIKPRAAEVDA